MIVGMATGKLFMKKERGGDKTLQPKTLTR